MQWDYCSSFKDSQVFKWTDNPMILHDPASFHIARPTWFISGVAIAMWWWVLEVDQYSGLEIEGGETPSHHTPSHVAILRSLRTAPTT